MRRRTLFRTKSDEESSDEAMQIDMESPDRKSPPKDDQGDFLKQEFPPEEKSDSKDSSDSVPLPLQVPQTPTPLKMRMMTLPV